MKSLKIMSRYLIILTLLVFSKDIFAQVKIGNNPKVMLPGALLELEHDSKALVITRVTTTQMNAIQANEGMLVYNTTDSCIYQRTSTAWKSLCSGANITSQNLTNGRGIIVMDGTGAVLKATSLRIDSSEIAKMMGERPIIDTLAKLIGRAPIKESVVQIIKDSISTIIQNGNVTGKDAVGSEIIKVNGGTGAVLKSMNITVDTAKMMTLISNNFSKSPLKDSLSTSITNIINNNGLTGKNMTSGNLVTLSGTPTGSLLKDVNIDINTTKMKDSIASWINDKPISDSITKYVSNDATIIKTMKDSVIKEITNGAVTGKSMTSGNLVTLSGTPTGSLLKDVNIDINTTKMKDSIASWINDKPISDSITKYVSNDATIIKTMKDSVIKEITNGTVTGKNATEGSLIKVTGGTGAVLKDMKVEADTVAMKTFIANNLKTSPIKDSLATSITNIINNNGVTGKNATEGSLIKVTGGTGAVLKDMKIEADTNAMKTFIANNLNKSPMKDSITKLMKDSISTIISNGSVTGKNTTAGSLITVTGGAGSALKDNSIAVDTTAMKTFIANNLNSSPIKDSLSTSITNIINNNGLTGKNMTSGNLVTLSGTPTGSLLKDVNIDINTTKMKDSIASWINDKPISDSITKYVSNDATIIKTMKDSVIKEITNGAVTGKSMTSGNLVTLSGTPTGSLLKDVNIDINTTKMKDSIASWINDKPISDSITKYVSNDATIIKTMKDSVIKEITNGTVTGKNATEGSLIKVTGGTGAVLKDMKVEADTVAMKTFIANNLNSSPIKDSLATSITNIINNNGVTGKNATQGSLITVTGGTGAVLKDMKIEADTNAMKTFIANNLNKSPMKDSITKLMKDSISTIISNGSVTGKNTTAGSLITVTGGAGSALKDNSIAVDTTAMKTFIANNLNSSPIKDSLGSSITNIINNNGVTGKDITNGNGIIVTGGAGAALKATSLRIDSTAIAKMINQSPVKDSVTKLMKDSISSIITNGGVTGKNATQGSLITVTGGTGAVLKDMKIEADTNAMKTFIANNLNKSPMKDSITKLMKDSISTIISNGSVTGKNTTAGSLITVTGGAGSALKDNSIAVDTTAMKTFIANNLNSSPIKDSLGSSITNIINNNGVTGKDITNGNGIIVTGGAGAALKATSLRIDSTAIAKMINQSPVKDSVTKLMKDSISSIITNGGVTGKNATQGSLITVTGGTGAVLKDMKIEADTNAMKTFIANNLNSSPIKDSLGSSITNIINNNGVTGKDITNGNGIIVTGGAGAALKATSLRIDSTAIAKMINQSPVKDSVTKLMKDSISSIITNGGVSGKALTGVGIKVSANGATSVLKDVTITWDSTAVYSKIKSDSVAITNMIVAAGSIDLDKDSTNEIQKLTFSNNVVKLSKGGDSVNLAGLIIDTTSLSNRINTNKQAIIDTATSLRALVNTHIAADLDIDSTNEIQKLSLSGNVIKLSKNGDSVSIAAFKNMAKNGTSISGDSVVLGGTLDRATTITTSATNTLTLAGLQSGASTDSIMTDSAGVVRHRSISTLKKEKVVIFTSSYTVLADDEILIYRGTGPTGTHTLTLPSAAANKDRVLQIVNMGKGDDIDLNLSTSILTIGGIADVTETFIRNTVSGAGYGAGASFGNSMKIVSDGTQWIKIGL